VIVIFFDIRGVARGVLVRVKGTRTFVLVIPRQVHEVMIPEDSTAVVHLVQLGLR